MTPYFEGWWRWVLCFGLGVWLGTALAGCHPPSPVCSPTAQRCIEGDAYTCSSVGLWQLSQACGEAECADVPADRFGAAGSACR